MNKEQLKDYFYKDEFGNYIISEFEDLGFNMEFEEINLLTKSLNIIGKYIEQLQQENKKLQQENEYLNSKLEKIVNYYIKETGRINEKQNELKIFFGENSRAHDLLTGKMCMIISSVEILVEGSDVVDE